LKGKRGSFSFEKGLSPSKKKGLNMRYF